MIDLFDVWKTYPNGVHALQGINMTVKHGEFVYLVGPSGAGKSTLLKMMYREEKPTKGQIFFEGFNLSRIREREIPKIRRKIGVVFQDFKLLPRLTVYENVAFALEVVDTPRSRIKKRVEQVLEQVQLLHKKDRYPSELSGGEQQRVSLARALANKPSIIIADEPTGNLDPETSWDIMELFVDINRQGTTVVMATHNKEIVNTIRRRVVAVENGRIVRDEQRGEYGYDR